MIGVALSADEPAIQNPCPQCGAETEIGFGLASGGYGVYFWCDACEDVVIKTQVED